MARGTFPLLFLATALLNHGSCQQPGLNIVPLYQNLPAPTTAAPNPLANIMETAGRWMGAWFRSLNQQNNQTSGGNSQNPFSNMMNGFNMGMSGMWQPSTANPNVTTTTAPWSPWRAQQDRMQRMRNRTRTWWNNFMNG